MEQPRRKKNRLENYDYRTPGVYFITACLKERQNLLWRSVGASIARQEEPQLSAYGEIVEQAIREIPAHYPAITVDCYAVMPNHIHLLLQIHSDEGGRAMLAPTVNIVVQQLKGIITKRIGYSIWQKSYHDHVIRGEADYLKIWQYIDSNPAKWQEDCFYTPE